GPGAGCPPPDPGWAGLGRMSGEGGAGPGAGVSRFAWRVRRLHCAGKRRGRTGTGSARVCTRIRTLVRTRARTAVAGTGCPADSSSASAGGDPQGGHHLPGSGLVLPPCPRSAPARPPASGELLHRRRIIQGAAATLAAAVLPSSARAVATPQDPTDFATALWSPAAPANYTVPAHPSERRVDRIVIHVAQQLFTPTTGIFRSPSK